MLVEPKIKAEINNNRSLIILLNRSTFETKLTYFKSHFYKKKEKGLFFFPFSDGNMCNESPSYRYQMSL